MFKKEVSCSYSLARQAFSKELSVYRHSHVNLITDELSFNSHMLRTLERDYHYSHGSETLPDSYRKLYVRYLDLVNAGINSLAPRLAPTDRATLDQQKGSYVFRGTLIRRVLLAAHNLKQNEFKIMLLSASRRRPDFVDFTPVHSPEVAIKHALRKLTVNDPVACEDRKDAIVLSLKLDKDIARHSKSSDECQATLLVPITRLLGKIVKIYRAT